MTDPAPAPGPPPGDDVDALARDVWASVGTGLRAAWRLVAWALVSCARHARTVAVYYWSHRGDFKEYLIDYMPDSRPPDVYGRETRIAAGQSSPVAQYTDEGWTVRLEACCVVCAQVTEAPCQDDVRSVEDMGRPLWLAVIGPVAAGVLALMLGTLWIVLPVIALGFLLGHRCRRWTRIEMRCRRCPGHAQTTGCPQVRTFGSTLILRVGCRQARLKLTAKRPADQGWAQPAVPDAAPIPLADGEQAQTGPDQRDLSPIPLAGDEPEPSFGTESAGDDLEPSSSDDLEPSSGTESGAHGATPEAPAAQVGRRDDVPGVQAGGDVPQPTAGLHDEHQHATFAGHSRYVTSVCLSGDGCRALSASNDRTLRLWDVSTGGCLRTLEGHTMWVTAVRMSRDAQQALSASDDKTIKLWELATGRCVRTLEGHTSEVSSVCFADEERLALSGGWDGTLRVWELDTGQCRQSSKTDTPVVLVMGPTRDGRHVLLGGGDNALRLWDMTAGACSQRFEGHEAAVRCGCLSTDGDHVLSGSDDGTLRLWERSTGQCVRTFDGHDQSVTSVCLSADGLHAVSGSEDATVKLWDVATGRCLRTFEGHSGEVASVCLTPDGRYALSGSEDTTVRRWSLG